MKGVRIMIQSPRRGDLHAHYLKPTPTRRSIYGTKNPEFGLNRCSKYRLKLVFWESASLPLLHCGWVNNLLLWCYFSSDILQPFAYSPNILGQNIRVVELDKK